ncbi:MAG TPA: potassium-transporting ATPase subunit KdpA [Conexibacter sp.]
MNVAGWAQIAVFVALLTACAAPLGHYMAKVFSGERVFMTRLVGPFERGVYRVLRTDPNRESDWKGYARAVLLFSLAGWILLYVILRTQSIHPFNPAGFHAGPWDLSFNTTTSFVTNTNWQFYGGETTLSNFSQMAGLAVQNFLSAATGIAVCIAVIRGFVSRSGSSLGNFWVDMVRSVLYLLLPIAVIGTLVLVSQGVVQSLSAGTSFTSLEGVKHILTVGPVASQEVIKMLGTNGGGFFNVNSAMPFENATGFSNFVEMFLILVIPAALTATFGSMAGNRRQGWMLFSAMAIMFIGAVVVVYAAEAHGSPAQHLAGIGGGNLEGKEQRFGIGSSSLFTAVTTVASCGAVNSAFDSLTGIGGVVPMANLMTGEVIFGGVGSGLYGMLLFVIMAVFIGGLMVGRTPELLGKKIGAREIKLTVIGTLAVPLAVLMATAVSLATRYGRLSIFQSGPQGFSETLYAYLSQASNNGSAFAGFTGFVQPNAPGNAGSFGITFADLLGSAALLIGRFMPIIAVLAVAGALANKRVAPAGPGTLRTATPTFTVLLIATVLLVALLNFVPALLLGPVVQGLTNQVF